jgi:hypothetical protein
MIGKKRQSKGAIYAASSASTTKFTFYNSDEHCKELYPAP